MRPRELVRSGLSLACLSFLAPLGQAFQNGTVKGEAKIADGVGGFTGTLSDQDQFGRSVCLVGDLDDDGVLDVAVGSPGDDDGGNAQGAVWILFLNADGTVKAHQKISETEGGFTATLTLSDGFGRLVEGLGDLDQDGVEDIAVGVTNDDDGGANKGAVFILFLNTDGTVKSHQKISELDGGFTGDLDPGDQFGRCLGNLGDLDGDGVVDLAVGASEDDDAGENAGAVWILFLDTDGTVKSHTKIADGLNGFDDDVEAEDRFGTDSKQIADLDGDGVHELAIGAIGDDDGGNRRGAVYICFMNTDGTVKDSQKISDLAGGFSFPLKDADTFGYGVSPTGDLNGDGVGDLAVGAPRDDESGPNNGAVYILFMNTNGTVASDLKIREGQNGFVGPTGIDELGIALDSLGDFDGDGVLDLLVGARLDDGNGLDRGAVWIFTMNGGVPTPVTADFSGSPTVGDAPLTVSFTNGSSGTVTSYSWDFGDSGSSSAQNPSHTYAASGTYTVSLTVTGAGTTDVETKTDYVTVNAPGAVSAAFSAAPTTGAAPLSVAFTDASTGSVTSYAWDFGDTGSSTLQDPTHEYTTAGTYTVSLTIVGPGGSDVDTQVDLITVTEPPPVAAFGAAPTSGDAPLTVAFTDASTGAVTSYSWDFGDSGSSTLANPTHEYALAGTYTVSLTVTGPGGSDVNTQASLITVTEPPPVAEFSGSPTSGLAPLLVSFTDASTGDVTGYSWDFGDTGTSTLQDPTHQYTVAGTYTVSLTVTGAGGSDAEVKASYVLVAEPPPGASFSASPTSGDAPLTVAFTDASTGAVTSFSWDFGDSGSSTLANPTHEYTAAGTYTVSLTVTGPGGSDVDTQASLVTVTEPAPVAAFGAAPTSGDAPLTVAFTDASSGAVTSYSWDFGDSGSSTLANPTHEYTAAGTYTVSLTVTGPGGSDVDTQASLITVTEPAPVAAFGAAPTTGDAPLTVAFTDTSSGAVTSYSWDFGDSGSSTLSNPTHEYTDPGTYTVSLTVTGPGGSDVDTQASLITVTEPAPVAAFGAVPTSGDAPLTVAFTDASSGAVTSYSWDFGDSGSSTLANPTHEYTDPGTYTVSLTVTGPGGSDVDTQASLITVTEPAPVAAFGAAPTSGDAPLTVAFTDASTGAVTSYSWDFGDSGSSTLANPTHEYTAAGTYTVSLTVTGPGGSDVDAQASLITVTEPAPVASFGAAPTSGDVPLTVAFTDASTGAVTSYSWDFGDSGSSTLANPTHEYTAAGTYTVSLTVTGPGGSDVDTQASLITVTEPAPVAAFGAAPTSGDAPTGAVTSY